MNGSFRQFAATTLLPLTISAPLTACSTRRPEPPAPIVPDAALLLDCEAPKINEAVLPALASGRTREAGAEYVRYVLEVEAALDRCNERMTALRAWARHVETAGAAQ